MIITHHAQERWQQRFGRRYAMRSLRQEFARAEKWKPNKMRKLGVPVDHNRRYYVTEICIFIVDPRNQALVTVLPRHRL